MADAVTLYGDLDREDAYDAHDPIPVRLAVLVRVLHAIEAEPDAARAERRRIEVARLLRRIADELTDG